MAGFVDDGGGSGGGVAASGNVLEMGVLEECGVFEAVAEEAVRGYVCDPDEGDCGGETPVQEISCEQESQGKREGVDEIVERGSEARVQEVADHEEVWSEEEDGEEKPAIVQVLVSEDGEGQEDGLFDAEQGGWAGQHAFDPFEFSNERQRKGSLDGCPFLRSFC